MNHRSLTDQRAIEERRWWEELTALADAGDVAGFFERYAAYLEWNNVISPSREVIHRMVKAAAVRLNLPHESLGTAGPVPCWGGRREL